MGMVKCKVAVVEAVVVCAEEDVDNADKKVMKAKDVLPDLRENSHGVKKAMDPKTDLNGTRTITNNGVRAVDLKDSGAMDKHGDRVTRLGESGASKIISLTTGKKRLLLLMTLLSPWSPWSPLTRPSSYF